MSAAIAAIAASAAAISASNSARIAKQEKQDCISWMSGFEDGNASVQQKQYYASCVQNVYPKEMTQSTEYLLKGCIVVVFVAIILGAYKGWKEDGDFEGTVLSGILGLVVSTGGLLFLYLSTMAISFLFS